MLVLRTERGDRAQFLSLKDKILDIIIIQGSECNDRVMLGYGIQQQRYGRGALESAGLWWVKSETLPRGHLSQ